MIIIVDQKNIDDGAERLHNFYTTDKSPLAIISYWE